MSYDLYFIKSKKLTTENIDEFLEAEASEGDDHFISNALKKEISKSLENNGLAFETFEGKDDDYLELNFETYQISIFSSQIAISLPYWDVNSSDVIGNEIKLISKVLFEKGFVGYDPQTEKVFMDSVAFQTDFGEVNEKVNESFSTEVKPNVSKTRSSEGWRLIKIGIIFFIVVFLIRLLASLLDKLF